jgi:hypothetical protein
MKRSSEKETDKGAEVEKKSDINWAGLLSLFIILIYKSTEISFPS